MLLFTATLVTLMNVERSFEQILWLGVETFRSLLQSRSLHFNDFDDDELEIKDPLMR